MQNFLNHQELYSSTSEYPFTYSNLNLNNLKFTSSSPLTSQNSVLSYSQLDPNLKRKETISDYDFKSAGKFTSNIRKNFDYSKNQNSSSNNSELTFDLKGDNLICEKHSTIKNIFLFADYTKFNPTFSKYSRICLNCESELKENLNGSIMTKLYDMVIRQNRSKIKDIREQKLSFGGVTSPIVLQSHTFLDENIYPIVDEYIGIMEAFETQVTGRFFETGNYEELEKLKKFVEQMKLDSKGDPILEGIGLDRDREREYISLAIFLIYFQGLSQNKNSFTGISESLKYHLISIIKLRKLMVKRLTDWLRLLTGEFYDYIFTSEGLEIDNIFRKNLQVDFSSDEEIIKLKLYFEQNLKQKDENIYNLSAEKDRLGLTNNQLLIQNEEYRKTINQMRFDSEIAMKMKVESITLEYENKMNLILLESQNLKNKFTDFQKNVNFGNEEKINSLTVLMNNVIKERDILNDQLNIIRGDVETYKSEILSFTNLKNSIEGQASENKKKFDEILFSYNKLKEEYNIKLTLIQKNELEIIQLGSNSQNNKVQINNYIQQIEGNKITIMNLNKQLEELKNNKSSVTEKDKEISSLKINLLKCREEWTRLSESYEGILLDIRKLVETNQYLNSVIYDMQGTIDRYNLKIVTADNSILKKIESLTQQVLTRRNIPGFSVKEAVKKCEVETDELKLKIARLENNRIKKENIFEKLSFINNGNLMQKTGYKNIDVQENIGEYQGFSYNNLGGVERNKDKRETVVTGMNVNNLEVQINNEINKFNERRNTYTA